MVTGIPLNGRLYDVLSQIKTGKVYSAILLDTSNVGTTLSAKLVFCHQRSAEDLVNLSSIAPVVINDGNGKSSVCSTRMLHSPTWPIPQRLERLIMQCGASRVLLFSGLPGALTCEAFVVFVCERGSCLLYTSPSPRDGLLSRMPSSA